MNRREFFALAAAVGASAVMPAAAELEAAPEELSLDEGVMWVPSGGKPVRLDVTGWSLEMVGDIELPSALLAKSFSLPRRPRSISVCLDTLVGNESQFSFFTDGVPSAQRGDLVLRVSRPHPVEYRCENCLVTFAERFMEPGEFVRENILLDTRGVTLSEQ